jgi:hypothetical protein
MSGTVGIGNRLRWLTRTALSANAPYTPATRTGSSPVAVPR